MRIGLLLLLILAATATSARSIYWIERGSWWIGALGERCVAASRPAIEMNVWPLGALSLVRSREIEGVGVEVAFWPGAFEPGQQMELYLYRHADGVLSVPATAGTDHLLVSDRGLTRAEMRLLRNATFMPVAVDAVRQSVGVQVYPSLGIIAGDLANCARLLSLDD